jgi:hypothetical protein
VLNIGPTYLDVAIASGKFTQIFGPASNNVGSEGKGDPNLRLRVDRFFSNVPFQRMAAALGQITSVKGGQVVETKPGLDKRVGGFQMDNLLKEVILSTFSAIGDDMTSVLESDGFDLGDLVSSSFVTGDPMTRQSLACIPDMHACAMTFSAEKAGKTSPSEFSSTR